MKVNSLFTVLVVGGAALTANVGMAEDMLSEAPPITEQVFCNPQSEDTCVVTVVNNQCVLAPKPGLECCWGTSCESN